ncbi:uncharacterized protein LOC105249739 isoform X1 [Camponotus floridanus]|nr:uncharacterized protein LOC105249739 isoform X1 [Camponotus floridanus]
MWKDKADRVCRFCKDVFCCAKCRDRHVNKMHFDLNVDCCLCAFEILPIRYGEFMKLNLRDEELLNHIVEKHLPLHCQLCGDLYKSKEDFKSFDKCKWWSQFSLSPIGLEQKLKQYCISNYNGICTPPELQRKTSTPMLGQKASFETPCVPYFSLKTPKTNSPINAQISQNSGICSITEFFSFSHISNEDTPFRTFKDEQSSKNNSGRKLNIMEEEDEIADNKAEKITADETVYMNLTEAEGGILESPASNICEKSDRTPDVVKKVRFSDQHETVLKCDDSIKSCVKITLNASTEEEKFHDAHQISSTPSAKNLEDTNDIKDTRKIVQDIENTKDNQVEIKKCSSEKPLQNSSDLQNDTKNTEKENQNPEIKDEDSSAMCRQESSRVLITVLMESNSGDLNTDLMPLINSGLKKLQEQLASTNQPSSEVESTDTVNLSKKSITRMQMSVENVESYSTKDPTDRRQIVPSSSLPTRNVKNNNGFFAAVAQAMKYALKSFSGLGIPASNNQVTTTEVIEQRKIIEESTSTSLEPATASSHSIQLRPNKRAREIAEVTPMQVDSAVDIQSPLAKRQKGWYTMIKARQPIHRMRNRYTPTSSKGVQVFSQGSLTVGDTVLPLPVRAHQSTQTE